jgi:hypothetical protein
LPGAVNVPRAFLAITRSGSPYTKNISNPNSRRKTHPRCYGHRFADLHAPVLACVVGAAA